MLAKTLRLRSHFLLLGFFVTALLPSSVPGLVLDPLSIETLSARAELIVHGSVLSKTCQRDPAGRIYTRIELQVAELWKGAVPGARITVVHGGGILGEQAAVVSGQVEYGVGEEIVAFLVRNDRGEGVTLGLLQGKFHIWEDKVTQTKYAVSPFHGLDQARAKVALQSQDTAASGPRPLPLLELRKRVAEVRP